MPHNEHIFPNGVVPSTLVPTPGRLREMDQRASEGLNAVDGGTYAPATRIDIGGAGVALSGATSVIQSVTTGPKSGGIVLTGSDAPTFAAVRTRKVYVPLFNTKDFFSPEFAADFPHVDAPYGIKDATPSGLSIDEIVFPIPNRYLMHGATLASVKLHLRYTKRPTDTQVTDGTIVSMRIARAPANGTPVFIPNDVDLKLFPTFVAAATYAVGAVILPTVATGKKWRCVQAGTVGPSTVGWSTTVGAVFTATGGGTSKWIVEIGPTNLGLFHFENVPYIDTGAGTAANITATAARMHNDGVPYALEIVPTRISTIDAIGYTYLVDVFTPPGNGIIYHSLELNFTGIEGLAVL